MTGPTDKEIALIVSNEQKWREYMLEEIREVKRSQETLVTAFANERLEINTLKVKFGFIAGIFGAVAGLLGSYLTKKLGA